MTLSAAEVISRGIEDLISNHETNSRAMRVKYSCQNTHEKLRERFMRGTQPKKRPELLTRKFAWPR
jgi:hypothetical protein